jgi:uncharacterized SAM-binding protein YcdF (DUF218 family)
MLGFLMETLQYNLTALAEPVGLVWLGLIFLMFRLWKKSQHGAAVWAGLLAALMTVVGSTPVPDRLLEQMERPYRITNLGSVPQADAVVVLGGGVRYSQLAPHGLDLTDAADRIVTGVELVRLGKAPNLVLGGATRTVRGREISEPELTRQWLASLPLSGVPMFILPDCHNTHDEALNTSALLKQWRWKRVLLVTSAYHMRRAAAVFQTAGVPVVCVGCDFQVGLGGGSDVGWVIAPQQGGFEKLELWMHEEIGWEAYKLRGWIKS